MAVLLWRGKASHEEPEGLVAVFFRAAPSELRAHFFDYLGRLLSAQHITVTEEVKERLQKLWEWRLQTLSALPEAERRPELDAFGWWFSSGKLDLDWSLGQCAEVLKLNPSIDHQRMVVRRLRECATLRPAETLACLVALLRDERAAWKVCWSSTAREAVREILIAVLATDSDDLRASARGVIDRLGSLGYLEFGELVGVRVPG